MKPSYSWPWPELDRVGLLARDTIAISGDHLARRFLMAAVLAWAVRGKTTLWLLRDHSNVPTLSALPSLAPPRVNLAEGGAVFHDLALARLFSYTDAMTRRRLIQLAADEDPAVWLRESGRVIVAGPWDDLPERTEPRCRACGSFSSATRCYLCPEGANPAFAWALERRWRIAQFKPDFVVFDDPEYTDYTIELTREGSAGGVWGPTLEQPFLILASNPESVVCSNGDARVAIDVAAFKNPGLELKVTERPFLQQDTIVLPKMNHDSPTAWERILDDET